MRKVKSGSPSSRPVARMPPFLGTNGVTYAKVSPADQIAANERRMRAISAALVEKAKEAARKAQAARQPIPTTPPVIRAQRPVTAAHTATMRAVPLAVGDWHAAARFTLGILRKPAALVDSTCRPVDGEVTQIHRGVIPGDWAGLAAEVDTGRMTHDQAVAMAGTWRRSAGVAS